jgi:hypothetical protein
VTPTLTSLVVALALSARAARAEPGERAARQVPDGGATTTLAEMPRASAAQASVQWSERWQRAEAAETPVAVVCQAAVALALAEPERARAFIARARAAGWLPELRFRVYRRFARTEGLTFDDTGSGAVAPVDISAVDDVRYEWRATWDLSRIVFNPDEIQAHAEALRMADLRRDIQTMVIRLYFERRRLVLEGGLDANSEVKSASAAAERRNVRISELEAQLDALSGGAFSAGHRTMTADPRAVGATSP